MYSARFAVLAVFAVALVNGVPAPGFSKYGTANISSTNRRGYVPLPSEKVDPVKVGGFERALSSAKLLFKNVVLDIDGLETAGITGPGPLIEKFYFGMTVEGKLTIILTVQNKEYTYQTDFTVKNGGVKAVVTSSCPKDEPMGHRRECDKKYEIESTFGEKPVEIFNAKFLNAAKDSVFQEWQCQNEKEIRELTGDLRNKFVKVFIDARKNASFNKSSNGSQQ